jgi:hypothetical protein
MQRLRHVRLNRFGDFFRERIFVVVHRQYRAFLTAASIEVV